MARPLTPEQTIAVLRQPLAVGDISVCPRLRLFLDLTHEQLTSTPQPCTSCCPSIRRACFEPTPDPLSSLN